MPVTESELVFSVRQLAQVQPIVTTPQTIFAPSVGILATVVTIMVANDITNTTFDLYHDKDGAVYDKTTIIASQVAANVTQDVLIELKIGVRSPGTIGFTIANANTAVVTLFGTKRR